MAPSDVWVNALGAYVLWQLGYLLLTEVLVADRLAADAELLTSLKWLARDSRGFMNRLCHVVNERLGLMAPDDAFDEKTWHTKITFWSAQVPQHSSPARDGRISRLGLRLAACTLSTSWVVLLPWVHISMLVMAIFEFCELMTGSCATAVSLHSTHALACSADVRPSLDTRCYPCVLPHEHGVASSQLLHRGLLAALCAAVCGSRSRGRAQGDMRR
eukprot:384260-Pleurochrysis_carterae.AAC.1